MIFKGEKGDIKVDDQPSKQIKQLKNLASFVDKPNSEHDSSVS